MKALFIVADGFEDMEYTCPRDILRRGGVEVVTASGRIDTTDDVPILGREGIAVNDHVILSMQDLSTFDILVIPGGGHYKILEANEDVISTIYAFNNNKKKIAAICAAPTILGHMGLLIGKHYTCFPSMNEDFHGIFSPEYTQVDGNLITGNGPAAAMKFGFDILENLQGKEVADKVKSQMYYKD